MPSTILGENALQLPAGTTRPTGSNGMIRFNTTTNAYENYHNLISGTDNWYGTGGKQLIARAVRDDAWTVLDIVWGWNTARFLQYEVYWVFADAAVNASRMYCQFYDAAGNLFQNSGSTGYTYVDNWAAANDGNDGAGQNFNAVNSNCSSSIPITNWYSADSGYWSQANGESQQAGTLVIHNSLPTNNTNNEMSFEGTYAHYTVSYGITQGRFGGQMYRPTATQTATRGGAVYPITGIRFGYLEGRSHRASASNGCSAIVTVYGLTGTEEREL
jgi:hypothetical protein